MNYNIENELVNSWLSGVSPVSATDSVDLNDSELAYLFRNENPLSNDERLHRLLQRCGELAPGRYPDNSYKELITKLSDMHNIKNACLAVGNGSSELLYLSSRLALTTGKVAMYSHYTFELYRHIVQIADANPVVIKDVNYKHDLKEYIAAAHKTSPHVIFIDNPCNPTGCYISKNEMEDFIKSISSSTLVVVDEAYFEYLKIPESESCSNLVNKYNNLIVVRTLSKVYGLAGVRIGYCIADPGLIELLNGLRLPFNLSSLTSAIAVAALDDQAFVEQSVSLVDLEKERLVSLIRGSQFYTIDPSANFIFMNLRNDYDHVTNQLKHQHVMIRPFSEYPGHVRMTIGLPEENQRFIDVISQHLNSTVRGAESI